MTTIILKLILFIVIGYLVGSIPSAVIISKKFFGFDIREKGSGNMGSTNAMRVLGTKWGIVVQICDILKGLLPVYILADIIAPKWNMLNADSFLNLPILEVIIGLAAVCGHIWSCFVGFKGGKGINTTLGMLLVVIPIEGGIGLLCFLITLFLTGYVSLGSLVAAVSIPLTFIIRHNFFGVNIESYCTVLCLTLAIVIIVFYAHCANIKRLLNHTENKFEKAQIFKCKKK